MFMMSVPLRGGQEHVINDVRGSNDMMWREGVYDMDVKGWSVIMMPVPLRGQEHVINDVRGVL